MKPSSWMELPKVPSCPISSPISSLMMVFTTSREPRMSAYPLPWSPVIAERALELTKQHLAKGWQDRVEFWIYCDHTLGPRGEKNWIGRWRHCCAILGISQIIHSIRSSDSKLKMQKREEKMPPITYWLTSLLPYYLSVCVLFWPKWLLTKFATSEQPIYITRSLKMTRWEVYIYLQYFGPEVINKTHCSLNPALDFLHKEPLHLYIYICCTKHKNLLRSFNSCWLYRYFEVASIIQDSIQQINTGIFKKACFCKCHKTKFKVRTELFLYYQ